MIKATTTKATYRGVEIGVMLDRTELGNMYSAVNSRSKPRASAKWFPTQGEAIANERGVIDAALLRGPNKTR